jgi:hypothetical protein
MSKAERLMSEMIQIILENNIMHASLNKKKSENVHYFGYIYIETINDDQLS